MQILNIKTNDLKPYANNPRKNAKAIKSVKESILKFGFKVPIVVDKNNTIVCGHTRWFASKDIGLEEVPCVVADDLTQKQIDAFRLVDNRTAEFAEWDFEKLAEELSELADFDLSAFGFDELMAGLSENLVGMDDDKYSDKNGVKGSLQERFIVAPFSVLNSRAGEWQERKRQWKKIISSLEGRSDSCLGDGLTSLNKQLKSNLTGTSEFDPVLCEILYKWFCPPNGNVLDPFCGGSVRGLVASFLDLTYTGFDIRQEQIDENYAQYENIKDIISIKPNWVLQDAMQMDKVIKDEKFDFMLACPPYFDLEKYSDKKNDLANMSYEDFLQAFKHIFELCYKALNENAFACIVIGEARNKKTGIYRNLVGHTVECMTKAGFNYYNECILINCVGTGAIRCAGYFEASRKILKLHQNILVFVKGDAKKATSKLGNVSSEIQKVKSTEIDEEDL